MRRRLLRRPDAAPEVPAPFGDQRLQPAIAQNLASRLRGTTELPRLLVIHVPKTAGTSLRLMLARHFSPDEVFVSTGTAEWTGLSLDAMRGIRLFAGHCYLEPTYAFPDDRWVTVLPWREPVSWWESWWKYRRRLARDDGRVDHPTLNETFDDFVRRSPDKRLANPQTSWLLARVRVMFDSVYAAEELAQGGLARLMHDGPAAADLLARLVERITVVGTTEDLLGTYGRTCAAMGLEPLAGDAPRSNASPEDPQLLALSEAGLDKLRRLTGLDQYGYELVQARLGG